MVDDQQNVDPVCFPMMRKFLVNWAAYMWVAGSNCPESVIQCYCGYADDDYEQVECPGNNRGCLSS